MSSGVTRLRDFVGAMTRLVDAGAGESEVLAEGGRAMRDLVCADD